MIFSASYDATNILATNFTAITATLPFLSLTNGNTTNAPLAFYDAREVKNVRVTQVDMGRLTRWLATNSLVLAKFPYGSGICPSILYVADNRTNANTEAGAELTVVRLMNGPVIPTNATPSGQPAGFTIATANPLYVWRNYNTTTRLPASLVSDALTVLSPNWLDSRSTSNLALRLATDTTINAAIMTGLVPSTGSDTNSFSGGLHNFIRLLEDWSKGTPQKTLFLFTSLVNLYPSKSATGPFKNPGQYYFAPFRNYLFETNFVAASQLPPGTPLVTSLAYPAFYVQPTGATILKGQTKTFTNGATGLTPLHYQWQFNGTNIAGATGVTLTVSNATSASAGAYSVVVTNQLGAVTSTNATLTVNYPATILAQPLSQATQPGSNAVFAVTAAGTEPLTYRWTLNGTNVPNGSSNQLFLASVQSNQLGSYRVVVTNLYGSTSSAPATLYLISSPDFMWVQSCTNPSPNPSLTYAKSYANSLALNGDGGFYAAGTFSGTQDFGGIILSNNSIYSANFLANYNSSGSLLWACMLGTNGRSPQVATDSAHNAYVAGSFSGSVQLGNNQFTSVGTCDTFIAKFDPLGKVLWARHIPVISSFVGLAPSLAVDNSDHVVIANYDGTNYDFGTVIISNNLPCLARYDSDGNLLWAREALSTGNFNQPGLATGTNGAIFLTGTRGWLAKYDDAGSLVWSNYFPRGTALTVDSRENLYVTGFAYPGSYGGFVITNSAPGSYHDFIIAKCDSEGRILWLRQIGSGNDAQQMGSGIKLDAFGNAYVASIAATLNPDPVLYIGKSTLTNVYSFLAKYDPSGNPLWARASVGSGMGTLSALAVPNPQTVVVAGGYSGSVKFGSFPMNFSNPYNVRAMLLARLDTTEPPVAPQFATQPQNQIVPVGANPTFSVNVPSGIPLTYQWYFNQSNAIPDATNSFCIVSNAQTADSGSYSVLVANDYGSTSSAPATLTVLLPPALSASPQGTVVLPGQPAYFACAATGSAPLAFQWKFNGADIIGATSNYLSVANVSSNSTGPYTVVVTNLVGSITSGPALLSLPAPQSFLWAVDTGRPTNSPPPPGQWSAVTSVASDSSRNVYAVGTFVGPKDFGGILLTNSAAYTWCNFVAKYDSNGNLVWVQQAGTNGWAMKVVTDTAGNAYAFGHFSGTVVFGTNVLIGGDLFLVKYSGTGEIQWARQVGANGNNLTQILALAIDASNNVIIHDYDGGTVKFDGVTLIHGQPFLAKYDSDGNLLWAKPSAAGRAIATGTNGAIYLGSVPGGLVKYDSGGNLVWSNAFAQGWAITLDANENIYSTGWAVPGLYDGFAITNVPGGSTPFWDFYVAKCDSTGHAIWLRQGGSISNNVGQSIVVDAFGNCLVAATSPSRLKDPQLTFGQSVITNASCFVAKYDANGFPLWAKTTSGPGLALIWSMTALDAQTVVVGGAYTRSIQAGDFALSYPGSLPTQQNGWLAGFYAVEDPALPLILVQPAGRTAPIGSNVVFTVAAASPLPLSYQWYFNQTNLISSATNSFCVIPSVQAGDSGAYSVTVSSDYGSTNSALATLTVLLPPVITLSPHDITAIVGPALQFTCAASGTAPLAFQWQFNGTNLPGATDSTLLLNPVTLDQTGLYRVLVTNLLGSATSSNALLSIYATAAATLGTLQFSGGDQLQMQIAGVPGYTYVIEGSTNLLDWDPLLTNTSPFTFSETNLSAWPQKFYRSVWVP